MRAEDTKYIKQGKGKESMSKGTEVEPNAFDYLCVAFYW